MDGSMIRKGATALVVLAAGLIATNKDALIAKLRGAAPTEVANMIDSKPAREMLERVARTASKDEPAATAPTQPRAQTLPGLRKALETTIAGEHDDSPPPEPPEGELDLVYYDAPLGKNPAYVTPLKPGAKGPGIVWIHGGFNWGIDGSSWEAAPRDNDQSGSAFRKAGVAQIYPALRGGSQAPGKSECFLGEVDDILAAADFLATRPDVDPARIYVAGHSTGAVLVLLAAESTPRFRAAFAFGPVADARQYGASSCIAGNAPENEWKPRAPIEFLNEISTPTLVIEGARGNAAVFPMMRERVDGAPVRFVEIPGATHFDGLAAGSELLAKAILADTGPTAAFDAITGDAIAAAMKAH